MGTISSFIANKKNYRKIILALAVLVLPLVFSSSEYMIFLCCITLIYIIAVSGLDILFGYCGQISMGNAAFYAIGAYASAILHNTFGWPMLLTMVLAALISTVIGILLAYPASKLVFHFLALSTVAFGEIVYQLILSSPGGITGDFYGIFSERLSLFGHTLESYGEFYYFVLACTVLLLLAKTFLVKSKTGRAFTAIRENTHAANGMGINVRKYKVIAFAINAFYTAFAGAIYMHLVGFVHPDMYLQRQSVLFLTMLLFGGTGSLVGPILGVISVELLIEGLRAFKDYQSFIYGILLLIVIVALPGGIYGGLKNVFAHFKNKSMAKTAEGDSNARNR